MLFYIILKHFSDHPECQFIEGSDIKQYNDHRSQISQFCGHETECRKFNSMSALQKAKANVEKFYQVVGVIEDVNMTLAVLEAKMPEFFNGAIKIYAEDEDIKEGQESRFNPYKLPVSDEIKSIVRANFTHEIEFYNFCKQRLLTQYSDLNLNDMI
jgi:dermatan/chondrotin sulfate uronyl 2-O-sulfotransferase UST